MLKTFFKFTIVILLCCSEAFAYCNWTTPGWIYLTGGRAVTINFANRHSITVACSLKRPGYMWWRGGVVCSSGYVYGRNYDGSHFSCRILSVR